MEHPHEKRRHEDIGAIRHEEIQRHTGQELAVTSFLPELPQCVSERFRDRNGRSTATSDFGPLTIGIDSHGNSLFHDVQERALKKLEELNAKL